MQNTLKNTLIINSVILITLLIYSLNRKKQSWKLWFFAYLVLLSSIIEQNIEPVCKKPTIYTSLFGVSHIAFSTYLILGSLLFGYPKIHLFILLVTLGGWLAFKGRCIAQIKYNKICGIDEKSPFVDIQNVIFNKILKISGTLYKWPLILLVILIDIYYILK
jgi:ABC-type xylose transport system permease subunit